MRVRVRVRARAICTTRRFNATKIVRVACEIKASELRQISNVKRNYVTRNYCVLNMSVLYNYYWCLKADETCFLRINVINKYFSFFSPILMGLKLFIVDISR